MGQRGVRLNGNRRGAARLVGAPPLPCPPSSSSSRSSSSPSPPSSSGLTRGSGRALRVQALQILGTVAEDDGVWMDRTSESHRTVQAADRVRSGRRKARATTRKRTGGTIGVRPYAVVSAQRSTHSRPARLLCTYGLAPGAVSDMVFTMPRQLPRRWCIAPHLNTGTRTEQPPGPRLDRLLFTRKRELHPRLTPEACAPPDWFVNPTRQDNRPHAAKMTVMIRRFLRGKGVRVARGGRGWINIAN